MARELGIVTLYRMHNYVHYKKAFTKHKTRCHLNINETYWVKILKKKYAQENTEKKRAKRVSI